MMTAVLATVALGGVRTVAAATQAGQAPEPLTALLAEVHALRLAMEQSATVAPRVQLTLARLNIEDQRIAQLASQLDQVRRELSAASLGWAVGASQTDALNSPIASLNPAPEPTWTTRHLRGHPTVGGRSWWAHFKFTRINIDAPTILRKKIEERRIVDPLRVGQVSLAKLSAFRKAPRLVVMYYVLKQA